MSLPLHRRPPAAPITLGLFAAGLSALGALGCGEAPAPPPPDPADAGVVAAADSMALPDEDWARLGTYAEDNVRVVRTPHDPDAPRVVFMGNSITELWPARDPGFFADHPTWINRGISGQTTEQFLVRFRPDVLALDPAVVVIHGGVNDLAYNSGPMTEDETFGNLVSMTQLARANDVEPVLAAIIPATSFAWRPGAGNPAEAIARLNARLAAYAHDADIAFVDYYDAFVAPDGGIDTALGDDSVHPNAAGYRVMRPLAEAAVAEALAKRD